MDYLSSGVSVRSCVCRIDFIRSQLDRRDCLGFSGGLLLLRLAISNWAEGAMKRIVSSIIVLLLAGLFLLGGRATSALDKYTVQVPNGLPFSDFRGYEDWTVIALSENGGKIAVILGNPR
jgi:hypothetical protein